MGELSETLRQRIADSGFSAGYLARQTNVSQSTISRFLNGSTNITVENFEMLCEFFGLRFAGPDEAAE